MWSSDMLQFGTKYLRVLPKKCDIYQEPYLALVKSRLE